MIGNETRREMGQRKILCTVPTIDFILQAAGIPGQSCAQEVTGSDPYFRKTMLVRCGVGLDERGTGSRETSENTGERWRWPEPRQGL